VFSVNACEAGPSCLVPVGMTDGGVSTALDRAERALERIERALERRREKPNQDEQLRAKVREAIAELDEVIRAAG
jgi:F0F1-type ATP synthase epsilon subunit